MIKIENLVKKYDNGFTENVIFNGFDVAIEDGEFVAIHGRSGCGKSTLLNIIGLIDSMSEGTYMLDGKDISKLKPSEYAAIRNRDIGFIFQAFHFGVMLGEVLRNIYAFDAMFTIGFSYWTLIISLAWVLIIIAISILTVFMKIKGNLPSVILTEQE